MSRQRPWLHPLRMLCLFAGALGLGFAATAGAQTPAPGSPYPREFRSDPQGDLAAAHEWMGSTPAHLDVAEGDVWIEREGLREFASANLALFPGDRLTTERGRARLLRDDGSAFSLDHGTDIDLLSESDIRLHAGRLHVTLARNTEYPESVVNAGGALIRLRATGEWVIGIENDRFADLTVRVHTLRGAADLESGGRRTLVRAGTDAVASERLAPSLPHVASANLGDFGRWLAQQPDIHASVPTTRYLPAEVRGYASTLDSYGSWSYEQPYGYVWFPRVDTTWQPYRDGRWSFFVGRGWIWTGSDRWSWPTHHYGRWGTSRGRWYWIPGRRWSPAWVSWVSAPGYVGWCPLGYDNRPVIAISVLNVRNTGQWNGWTVIPSHAFSNGVHVRQHVAGRFPGVDRFVPVRSAPDPQWSRQPVRTPEPSRVIAPRTRGTVTGVGAPPSVPAPTPRLVVPSRAPQPPERTAPVAEPRRPTARVGPAREPVAAPEAPPPAAATSRRAPARPPSRVEDRTPPAEAGPPAGAPPGPSAPQPRRARPRTN